MPLAYYSGAAYAINLGHQRIESEDIARGLRTYAQDLVIEVDRELGDVFRATSLAILRRVSVALMLHLIVMAQRLAACGV